MSAFSPADVAYLRAQVAGRVLLPGDEDYESELRAYNFAVPAQPTVIVGATDPSDIQYALAFAEIHDLPVAVLNTGHTTFVPVSGPSLMITVGRLNSVSIDPTARRARVGGGVRWQQVVDAAAEHGLAPLNGSSPQVGVVGYTLGGGLSATMGRAYGWASDHVTSLEIVTSDRMLRQIDAHREPELFWAVRAGKSNFGVVTAMEFELFPVRELHGGVIIFAGDHAEAVLNAYADLTAHAPDELTSSIAFMRLPDIPVFPEPLRGQFTVHVRISWIGDEAAAGARELLAPLRACAPVMVDSVAGLPYSAFASIYSDPTDPAPFAERTATLPALDTDLVKQLIDGFGPGQDVPATIIELRHLGGALARPAENAGAAGLRDASFALWIVTVGPPVVTGPANAWVDGLFKVLARYVLPGKHLNFMAHDDLAPEAIEEAFPAETFSRLQRAKAVYDPENIFRLNHNIPPLD